VTPKATLLLLGTLVTFNATAAAEAVDGAAIFLAVDPFHGDGETGGFIEYRRQRVQLHAGCFNPCAAGIEYVWRLHPNGAAFFLGAATLNNVNQVNGTRTNFVGGFSVPIAKHVSAQFRHYSNGARWHSPISDEQAPNLGWNFIGLKWTP
jgi:hypothetical protein